VVWRCGMVLEELMYRAFQLSIAGLGLAVAPALADEHEKSNLLDLRFDLTVWTIVIFAILFLVLRKFAWGPILEGLQNREHSIESAIEEAKRVRDEMAKQSAEFQRQIADANQQIPKLLEQARRDAEHLREEMRTQAAADINAERQRLRREIEVARDQALQDIWNQAANLATVISARAIRKALAPEDHRRLVDEALSEIEVEASKDQSRASEIGLEWVRQAGGKL
jgi:F-type H+-transporting ATPase subunit b